MGIIQTKLSLVFEFARENKKMTQSNHVGVTNVGDIWLPGKNDNNMNVDCQNGLDWAV